MSVPGTKLPIPDVRALIAFGGKADVRLGWHFFTGHDHERLEVAGTDRTSKSWQRVNDNMNASAMISLMASFVLPFEGTTVNGACDIWTN